MRLLLPGLALLIANAAGSASAQNLSQLAKQQGCTGTPVVACTQRSRAAGTS